MGRTYLRYAPSALHGVVASPGCRVAVDPAGRLAYTGQLENVGVWNVRRGVQVRARVAPGRAPGARPPAAASAASPARRPPACNPPTPPRLPRLTPDTHHARRSRP